MIGGADMYMPLCRACHSRETRHNEKNVFEGDPEQVDVKVENEAIKLKNEKNERSYMVIETLDKV